MTTRSHRHAPPGSPLRRARRLVAGLVSLVLAGLVAVAGCAKYNTYYNASRAFRDAEDERKDAAALVERCLTDEDPEVRVAASKALSMRGL